MTDGGGLCSPGRWQPDHRPPSLLPELREAIRTVCSRSGFVSQFRDAVGRRFRPVSHPEVSPPPGPAVSPPPAGSQATPPWDLQALQTTMRNAIDETLTAMGHEPLDWTIPPDQPVATRALGSILALNRDPDCDWVRTVGDTGVNMGVVEPLPRTPMVFRKKLKWRLPEWPDPPSSCTENYPSAVKHQDVIEAQMLEDKKLGRVRGPGTKEMIADYCGCTPEDLVLGKLAVIEEAPGKHRIILDETAPHTNNLIRPQDQHDHPGLADERIIMRWAQGPPEGPSFRPVSKTGQLKFDISGAHRLVKKVRRDWRFLAAKVGEQCWVSTVGAFGEGSAAYWWARRVRTLP